MQRRRVFLIAGISALVIVSAWVIFHDFSHHGYEGDGVFTEDLRGHYGTRERVLRFKVDFGEIDLTKKGEYVFSASGLPEHAAHIVTIGLLVRPRPDRKPDEYLRDALVRLRVVNEREEEVVIQSGRLEAWDWMFLENDAREGIGPALVGVRGLRNEIPIDDIGSVRVEHAGVKADGGWGTLFEPREDGSYSISIEVLEPDAVAGSFQVNLMIRG